MELSRRQRQQLAHLGLYFFTVAAPGVVVSLVIGPTWNEAPWGLPVQLFAVVHQLTGIQWTVPYFLVFGVYLGPLLVITFLDRYKYVQGLIVWLGLGLASLFVFLPNGILIGPLLNNLSLAGVGLFAVGIVVGGLMSGLRLDTFINLSERRQYPLAIIRLRQFTAIIVGLGLFEAAFDYLSPVYISPSGVTLRSPVFIGFSNLTLVVVGLAAGCLLYWGLGKFLRYELQSRTIQIGPERSGKTAMFGGLYAHINDINPGVFVTEVAEENVEEMQAASRYATTINDGEFPESTEPGEINLLSVIFDSTKLLRERVRLYGVDYAGEQLKQVLEPVIGTGSANAVSDGGTATSVTDGKAGDHNNQNKTGDADNQNNPDPGNWSNAIGEIKSIKNESEVGPGVWNCIKYADRIILTVPFEDFIGPIAARGNERSYAEVETTEDSSSVTNQRQIIYEEDGTHYYLPDRADRPETNAYLRWYYDLIQNESGKEYILAVTKCDHAKDDFGNLPVNNESAFRNHIFDIMKQQETQLIDILEATDEDAPFALWYPIKNDKPPEQDGDLTIDRETGYRPLLRGADSLRRRLER